MAIPRSKKPKKGAFTLKEVREKCKGTGHQVQLVMAAAMYDVLNISNEEMIKVLAEAARYSQYYDENLVHLKTVADSVYKSSKGEIDLRTIEMRLRCQRQTH